MKWNSISERFLLSFFAMLAVSWLFGLVYVWLALIGPLIAGAVFVRFRAGVTRRPPLTGASMGAAAVAAMVVPVAAIAWIVLTATSEPGEAESLIHAALDFNSNSDRVQATVLVSLVSVSLGAIGGGVAAWQHRRQLDSSYWVSDDK